jgi:predicted Zn-ribbon and HTH transcriptional regulator
MASEDTGEQLPVSVSDDVQRWLQRRADEHGVDVERFVRELLAAHHAADESDDPADEWFAPPAEAVDQDDLDAVRDDFRKLLEDVRSRVVQVKRETDEKAPVDHDHETIRQDLEGLEADLEDLDDAIDCHDDRILSLEVDVEEGFENFEDVLEYLLETTDDLAERTDRLARATIDARERLQSLAGSVEKRDATDRLKRDAALDGIASADCEDCGRSVRAGQLTAPECPFCASNFVDVEPKQGLLGSATFVTGDRPALVGTDQDAIAAELRSDVVRERPDPADVDWDVAGDDET